MWVNVFIDVELCCKVVDEFVYMIVRINCGEVIFELVK